MIPYYIVSYYIIPYHRDRWHSTSIIIFHFLFLCSLPFFSKFLSLFPLLSCSVSLSIAILLSVLSLSSSLSLFSWTYNCLFIIYHLYFCHPISTYLSIDLSIYLAISIFFHHVLFLHISPPITISINTSSYLYSICFQFIFIFVFIFIFFIYFFISPSLSMASYSINLFSGRLLLKPTSHPLDSGYELNEIEKARYGIRSFLIIMHTSTYVYWIIFVDSFVTIICNKVNNFTYVQELRYYDQIFL